MIVGKEVALEKKKKEKDEEKEKEKKSQMCELQKFGSLNEEILIPNKTLICYLKTVVGGI